MKAKFGKTSIGCFVAMWCSAFVFKEISSGDSLLQLAIVSYFMLLLIGIMLALFGWIKNETPKVYGMVGLVINVAMLSILLLKR